MSDEELALLGHLIGDGCTLPSHAIQYTSNDLELAKLVAALATDVFDETVRPRINKERSWYQTYLPAAGRLTHGVRNPIAAWLDELGIFGLRSYEKRVPEAVFAQPPEGIAVFLRHLWATDGCIRAAKGKQYPVVRYDTSSRQLGVDVQSLLLRLGLNAKRRTVAMPGKGRELQRIDVTGRGEISSFLSQIGGVGPSRSEAHEAILAGFAAAAGRPNTNRDVIPREAWSAIVDPARAQAGISTRELQSLLGTEYCGSTLYRSNLGRERASRVAEAVESDELRRLATGGVYWDEIAAIEPDGVEDVYDLTVEGLHNFVAEDISVHNSIEQDSDLVMFIYRDEYYNDESDQQGIAEVILAKHRNGPTDAIKLSFLKRYAKFADLAAAA
jgi:replicative DNA helicase